MPQQVFTMVARGFSVDVQSNTLSLFSIVEELHAPSVPFAVPELSIVTVWELQPGDRGASFVQRTRFMDPDGKEVSHFDSSFRMDHPRHRMLGRVSIVPFHQVGTYRIEVSIRPDDDSAWAPPAASYPIEVLAPQQGEESLYDSEVEQHGA